MKVEGCLEMSTEIVMSNFVSKTRYSEPILNCHLRITLNLHISKASITTYIWDPITRCTHLKIPDEFLKTVVQWVSFPGPLGSHPEWGITTMLTSTKRASSMMVRLRSSQDERFHRTPVTSSLTSLSVVFLRSRTKAVTPPAALIALLFSSFWRP